MIQDLRNFHVRFRLVLAFSILSAVWASGWAVGQTPGQRPPVSPTTQPDQTNVKPTSKTHPHEPMLWDVRSMIEEAAMTIARRYTLTADQENYTRMLIQNRVKGFLDKYEVEVRELLQESIEMRIGTKSRSIANLQDWAIRAAPIYEAAKEAILEGNEEWSQILSPEQMVIYDDDRQKMLKQFDHVASTLQRWESGGPYLPQTTQLAGGQKGGDVSTGVRVKQQEIEANWPGYVNLFIAAYRLEADQANSAREKVLKEQLEQAGKHREKNKAQLVKIERELESPDRKTPRNELLARKSELERPIRDLFVELDKRLKGIATNAQMANPEPNIKTRLDKMYDELSSEKAPAAEKRPSTIGKVKPDKPAEEPEKPDAKKQGTDEDPEPKTGISGGDKPSNSAKPSDPGSVPPTR